MKRDERFPTDLTDEQVAYLLQGGSIIHGGRPKSLPDFGIASVDPAAESETLKLAQAAIKRLEGEANGLHRQIRELEKAKAEAEAKAVDLTPYLVFLPKTKSEVEGATVDQLKALATIRDVTVKGEGKAPYVAALSPKEA